MTITNEADLVIYHNKALAMHHIRQSIEMYHTMPLSKRETLVKWRKKVKSISEPEFMPYEHLYDMTIGLPTGIFSYQFDITKILMFLQQEEIQPIELDTDMMLSHVDQTVWADHPNATPYPPVVLETPLLPKGHLLLGHKMIMEAKKKGKKKVSVYVLGEMEYVPLMFDDISKAMYGFHRDLQNLLATTLTPPSKSLFLSHVDTILKVSE